MPSTASRDVNPIIATSKSLTTGKKKPAKKTGALGTPKKKATKKKTAKKTRK